MIQTTNQKTISLVVNKDRFDNPQSKYTLILKVPKDQQDDYLLTTTNDRNAGRPPTAYLELSITINQDGLPKLLTQFIPATTKEGSTVALSISNIANTPTGMPLMTDQAITLNLQATKPDARINLPPTLTLPAKHTQVTTSPHDASR